MARWLPLDLRSWIDRMAQPLDSRVAERLLTLFLGLLFASGRKTVAAWLCAAGVGADFQVHYYFLGSLGHKVKWVALQLLRLATERILLPSGERLLFALDDTPTKRYGPCVEGAGIHHNPTPGPADQKFLYGHIWVTLSWVVRHARWGTIGLPLLAMLYVRAKTIAALPPCYGVTFRTKLEQAVELLRWLQQWLERLGRRLWVVADGAYAKRLFLKEAATLGVTIVSRLRRDAALRTLPPAPRRGQPKKRGRPAKYGKEKISLAKRAAHAKGWITEIFELYGERVSTTYKTFLATYRPAGGTIRVVIVRDDQQRTKDGWVAYFCTDANATVAEILTAVADRAAVEQNFHDIKEVHGAGEQQVRNYWANIAVYHLTLWWHTLVELWAWRRSADELVDRSDRPWDDPTRRPSHRDRCNSLRRSCLENELSDARQRRQLSPKIAALLQRMLRLVG